MTGPNGPLTEAQRAALAKCHTAGVTKGPMDETPCPLCGEAVKTVPSHIRYKCPGVDPLKRRLDRRTGLASDGGEDEEGASP